MNNRLAAFIALILIIVTATTLYFNIFSSSDQNSKKDFTLIVLPDIGGYVLNYPWIFENQTQWITQNIEKLNIVFVSQLGDLVSNGDNITQWEIANQSMSKLDDKIPWATLPGNHDVYYGNSTNYETFFGSNRFKNQNWYGGTYKPNSNSNSYQLFSAGGDNYIIFHIQYKPTDDILFWTKNVIDQYPDRRVIISTHDYINGPFNSNQRSEIGERIWYNLIKQYSNRIFLVLCGHANTQNKIIDKVGTNTVYQLLADYQNSTNIESGWLRILEFIPAQNKIVVKTYSPYLKRYKIDPYNLFTLEYNMTGN
ncbi:MAG: metallophosphoesterase [Candidatus Bathyarchaeota archaeon]